MFQFMTWQKVLAGSRVVVVCVWLCIYGTLSFKTNSIMFYIMDMQQTIDNKCNFTNLNYMLLHWNLY